MEKPVVLCYESSQVEDEWKIVTPLRLIILNYEKREKFIKNHFSNDEETSNWLRSAKDNYIFAWAQSPKGLVDIVRGFEEQGAMPKIVIANLLGMESELTILNSLKDSKYLLFSRKRDLVLEKPEEDPLTMFVKEKINREGNKRGKLVEYGTAEIESDIKYSIRGLKKNLENGT